MDDDFEVLRQLAAAPELLEQARHVSGTELQRQAALREHYAAPLVRGALLLNELRSRAQGKFTRAAEMWFDRTGLEQSTAERVASHKAARFANTNLPVIDLCSGIGADAIALALSGLNVVAVDQSAAAGSRMMLNAEVYGVADRIQARTADVTTFPLDPGTLVHIDPDRRAGRTRAMKLEDYAPPLEFLQQLPERSRGGAIKLSPASNFGGKFSGCEIELISLDGECKEATVWYGDLAGSAAMRATVLPSGYSIAGNPWELRPHVGPLGKYIYDPDPAIVRSGLLDLLVEQLPLHRLDAAEEYLTSDELIDSPAVTPFEVLENLPNNDTAIRKAIRAGAYGDVEIKSRHVPVNAEAMRKKMSLTGLGRATLIIARLDGRTRGLLCRRVVGRSEEAGDSW